MKDAASDLVIIDRDGHTFVSTDYVERIPIAPPDQTIQLRFANPTEEDVSPATCLIRIRQGMPFYSLSYLNRILSSPKNARPLRVNLAIQTDADHGDQHIVLGLRDLHDNSVPLSGPSTSAGNDALQAVIQQQTASPVSRARPADRFSAESPLAIRTLGSPKTSGARKGRQKKEETRQLDSHIADHADSLAKKQQPQSQSLSTQQQAGSSRYARNVPTESWAASNSSILRGLAGFDECSSRPTANLTSATPFDAVTSGDTPRKSLSSRGSSQHVNTTLCEQLRDLQMTDADVLQSLAKNKLPKALSVLANASGNMIPFVISSSGQSYSIKPFVTSLETPKNLGIPLAEQDKDSLWGRQLLPKIERFCNASEQLRFAIRFTYATPGSLSENGVVTLCRGRIPGLAPADKAAIRAMLDDMSTHTHDTAEKCIPRIRTFVKNHSNLRELLHWDKQFPLSAKAASIHQRATEILEYVDTWNENASVLPVLAGSSNLVRSVLLSGKALNSVGHGLPKYVLPLGRLCRMDDSTHKPTELDEVVVMDMTSPSKALWRYRFLHTPVQCCYSFEMLAADIKELTPDHDADDEAQRDNRVPSTTVLHKLAREYPDSRVDLVPGELIFTHSRTKPFLRVVQDGWGLGSAGTRRKRKIADEEPRDPKPKRGRL